MPSAMSELAPLHLLVLTGDTSSRLEIAAQGVVQVGRDPQCEIVLDDAAASRRHAKLVNADGRLTVTDLDSRNGTQVNGERIIGAQVLTRGDIVSIGSSHIIVQGDARSSSARVLPMDELRQRLIEEVDRSLRYHRSLALLALVVEEPPPTGALAWILATTLPSVRVIGSDDARLIVALLPEHHAAGARALGQRVVETLSDQGGRARAAVAVYPDDGGNADSLIAGVRTAARRAEVGEVVVGGGVAHVRRLGEREVIVADPAMVRIYELIERLARSNLTVLICGETGSGKENAAFAVHHGSPRAGQTFLTLNCAALQDTLLESELFGHKKGAFSGATSDKIGLLEQASGGTVFLDEVGELSLAAQAKLLRSIENRRIIRLGDTHEREIDIRIVAATNRDLEQEVAAKRFRQDLYFRLSTALVHLPPLRERPGEIPILARAFLQRACEAAERDIPGLSGPVMARLTAYHWPGNVRELSNVIRYVAAIATGPVVEITHLPAAVFASGQPDRDTGDTNAATAAATAATGPRSADAGSEPRFRPIADELRELEMLRMTQALDASDGVQTQAARLLGMPIRTFVHKLKRYGMTAKSRS
jgi:DNA-binding NtrC family response regulator